MSDFKKIMERIPREYQRQKIVNGISRNTYFFKTWVGYDHPIHLRYPLSYKETQNRGKAGYYEASLDTTSGKVPLLILVENLYVKREPIEIEKRQLGKNRSGEVYYLFQKANGRLILDQEVKLDDTFDVTEYVHVVFGDKGDVIKSELAQKKCEYSYAYEYDKNGLLAKVLMKREESIKILERGKDF